MSVHKTVRRLQNDMSKFRKAERELKQDRKELKQDRRELKGDRRELRKDRKDLGKDRKTLEKDRTSLGRVRERQQEVLGSLAAKKAELEQRYADSFDPADPAQVGDPALLEQLTALEARTAEVSSKFETRIAEGKREILQDRRHVEKSRNEVQKVRSEIKEGRREIKQDLRELKHDRQDVKRFRKEALSHLRPAEYHMSLKRTNHVRKDLGLKPLDEARRRIDNVVGGQVGKWIAKAQLILKRHGVPLSKMDARAIALIIRHESGGNPNAQNNWDSNAAAGTPSIGLMQTIGPTFNSYKLPGHGNIRDPIDNIIAGVRYAISRYGSVSNVPGVVAVRGGRAYEPY